METSGIFSRYHCNWTQICCPSSNSYEYRERFRSFQKKKSLTRNWTQNL